MTETKQPELIQRVGYRPSDTRSNQKVLPLWQQALGAVLLITTAALWFLFTAKSVVITFAPDACCEHAVRDLASTLPKWNI